MKGSYINVWIPKGAKVKDEGCESLTAGFGFENPTFNPIDSNELVSLGFVPIEDKVYELLGKVLK